MSNRSRDPAEPVIRREILGIALLGAAGLSLAALVGEGPGLVGGFLYRFMRTVLGQGSWVVPLFLATLGGLHILRREVDDWIYRLLGLSGVAVLISSVVHLAVPPASAWRIALEGGGGGLVGSAVTWVLGVAFGYTGQRVALVFLGLVVVVLLANRPLSEITLWAVGAVRSSAGFLRRVIPDMLLEKEPQEIQPSDHMEEEEDDFLEGVPVRFESSADAGSGDAAASGQADDTASATEPAQEDDPVPKHMDQVPISRNVMYQLPPLDLLQKPRKRSPLRDRRDARSRARLLEETLASFGVEARVLDASSGPAVTRFEVQPAPGVKVSRIVALADDIALSLATTDVRVVAPIPGKAAVGIEVPNRQITPVHLRDVLESDEFQHSRSKLAIGLGKDIAGRAIATDMEKMLHLLIAGATGSGKSICLNSMIISLLYKARPEEVKLLLIDPKRVELSQYDGIPHLLSPVVTDAKKAASCLRWAVKEMERRYELFASMGVRDIYRHNERAKSAPPSAGGEQEEMSHLVVVIDELADLMGVAPVDVEDAIQRLAQMARAAGIHLVVATQRPSVDVITGVIKANIPSRIAFSVSSGVDSRTILDMSGAEKLVGKGDMLFYPVGASKPIRVQGSFISEEEVEAVLSFVKSQAEPEFEQEVVELDAEGADSADEEEDELVMRALEVVVESGQASVSMLQRRLRVGYTRAGRLIDALERRGYIGPYQGSKARDVHISREEYDRLLSQD